MLQKKIERKRTRGRQQYNWKDNIGRWTFCILSLCSVKRQRVLNFHSSQPSFWIWSLFDWLIDDHIHSYSLSTPCGGRDLDYGRVGGGGLSQCSLPACCRRRLKVGFARDQRPRHVKKYALATETQTNETKQATMFEVMETETKMPCMKFWDQAQQEAQIQNQHSAALYNLLKM